MPRLRDPEQSKAPLVATCWNLYLSPLQKSNTECYKIDNFGLRPLNKTPRKDKLSPYSIEIILNIQYLK